MPQRVHVGQLFQLQYKLKTVSQNYYLWSYFVSQRKVNQM